MKPELRRIGMEIFLPLICLLVACASEERIEPPAEGVAAVTVPRPTWLSEEPLIIVGNWDTAQIFRTRKGGNPLWHEEDYRREHTEEAVIKLKELGVTMAVIHFYKGFGLEAEKEQLEDARILAALCKQHGIRVGVYVGSTIAYETFLLEKPEAEEWFVPDYMGRPVRYGGTQTFRRRVYFMHPGFIDYMKQVLRIAIEELQVDLIHFDNTSLRAQRPAFHHPLAKQHFREFLSRKYTPAELKTRLGFSDTRYVVPPIYEEPLETIDDPLFQEWTDFRCQQLADFYAEMARFIRGLNPEVAVENNPHSGLSGINTMWEQGIDYPRLLAHTDIVWTEEGNEAGVTDDGRLVSKIRTYKQAATLRNKIFTYTSDSLLQLAEAMTFNRQCLGMVGGVLAGYELSESRSNYGFDNPYTWGGDESGFALTRGKYEYIKFFKDNFQYYRNVESAADVAVLHSYAAMAFSNGRPYQSTFLFEQALIQNRVPFDIIFDDNLSNLSKYRVLVLPDQEALSDAQLDQIRKFVAQGGGLVATEHTSLYNEWRQRRKEFGLQELFQVAPPRWQARGRRPEPTLKTEPVRREVGSGRVVYIPEVIPALEKPPTAPMTSQYWQLPVNHPELVDSVRWAGGNGLLLESAPSSSIVSELTEQQETGELLLHLINYDVRRTPEVTNFEISLRIAADRDLEKMVLISPELEGEEELVARLEDGRFGEKRLRFEIPRLLHYDLVIVRLD